jgi:GntR family transcriptional repressor for pyruvate dehydrogenase complex
MMLRDVLEPGIAAVAAREATADDLAWLQELVEQLESAYAMQDIQGLAQADVRFHEALATATHNELIVAVMGGLQRVMKTWLTAQAEAGYGRYEQATRGHRVIYQAVASRDPQQAREAMQVHLEYARTSLGS